MKVNSFSELKAIKKAIELKAKELAEQQRLEQLRHQKKQHEKELFARTVGLVIPIKDAGRVVLTSLPPLPIPFQRQLDDQQVLREALSDDIDVETLLDTDENLSYRRQNVRLEVVRQLRRGRWVIQGELDLHGLRRDEARNSVAEFIRHALKQKWRCVRIIHGKGHGSPGREPVLKNKVRGWLVQKEEVMAFAYARASDGGHGAVVILLQNRKINHST